MKYLNIIVLLFIFQSTFAQLKVGDTVPDFKLWLTDNTIITKKDTKNKVVVFKFWFTSCVPCITGIPNLNKLVKKYKNQTDLLLIAPALDNKQAIERFQTHYPFNFKIAYNSYNVSLLFNPKGIYPTYIVINKNGKIVYIDSQTKEKKEKDLLKIIDKLMAE